MGAATMALLQLTAFAVLPAADGVLDAASAGLPVHVESERSADCAPQHDHLFCQVVRSLSSATRADVASFEDAPPPIRRIEARTAAAGLDARRLLTPTVGPRAPPLG